MQTLQLVLLLITGKTVTNIEVYKWFIQWSRTFKFNLCTIQLLIYVLFSRYPRFFLFISKPKELRVKMVAKVSVFVEPVELFF